MRAGYPATFMDLPVDVPQIFDPALQHFARGFRQGDPVFADEATAARWRTDRRVAMEAVLRVLAERVADQVVLRGSVLNRAWFPATAREPHDIDVVVVPSTLGPADPRSEALIAQISAGVCGRIVGRVRFSPTPPPVASIWTYERAEGRRLVFSWISDEGTPGLVQVDLVFGEALPTPPVPVVIPCLSGPPPTLQAASPELALAWKILWLTTDMHGQGKDLVDAVLLAEHQRPDLALINRVLEAGRAKATADDIVALARTWSVEWQHLEAEYGAGVGSMEGWMARLAAAWGG